MEQLKIQLDTIINGQTEILKELRDVKQNVVDLTEKVDQLSVRIDAFEGKKPPLLNTPNQCLRVLKQAFWTCLQRWWKRFFKTLLQPKT